jgi:RNA polymerase sigma-70 factor (ECF subfamily)
MESWLHLASLLAGETADAALPAALEDFHRAGRSAWPELAPLPATDLVAHLAFHLPPGVDRVAHLRSLVAEDLYLACACLVGLPGALAPFVERFLGRVPAFLAHLQPTPAFAEEITRRLRERLLVAGPGHRPRIADYPGKGALLSWLRICAVRVALAHRDDAGAFYRPPANDDDVFDELAVSGSLELQRVRARHGPALIADLRHAQTLLSASERALLRRWFGAGENTERLAATLRLDRTGAARQVVAARQTLYDTTWQLLRQRLAPAPSDTAGLALALHDQLNVSLSELLMRD